MHCNLCGAEFEDGADACPGCGVEANVLQENVQLPPPRGAVNDFPRLLNEAESGELSSMVSAFFKQTDVPVVIAVVHSTKPLSPSEYAFILYNHWGIGQKGVNRGLMLLLSLSDKHIESEIGLGLEEYLPEEVGDEIVQTAFVPHFKEGEFFEGLKAGTKALMDALLEKLPTLH